MNRTSLFLTLFLTLAGGIAAYGIDLTWYTFDGGGAMVTTGGTLELSGTIGQLDAGSMTGGNWELAGGFWPGAVPLSIPHDSDGDGDVDLDDYVDFFHCMRGPGAGSEPKCAIFDSDGNGDVDLRDFAAFQQAFTSPLP